MAGASRQLKIQVRLDWNKPETVRPARKLDRDFPADLWAWVPAATEAGCSRHLLVWGSNDPWIPGRQGLAC